MREVQPVQEPQDVVHWIGQQRPQTHNCRHHVTGNDKVRSHNKAKGVVEQDVALLQQPEVKDVAHGIIDEIPQRNLAQQRPKSDIDRLIITKHKGDGQKAARTAVDCCHHSHEPLNLVPLRHSPIERHQVHHKLEYQEQATVHKHGPQDGGQHVHYRDFVRKEICHAARNLDTNNTEKELQV
jgi:hypothetical protein